MIGVTVVTPDGSLEMPISVSRWSVLNVKWRTKPVDPGVKPGAVLDPGV